MEVDSSRPDYLPILSAAKTVNLSLLVKHHILAIDEASKQHQHLSINQGLFSIQTNNNNNIHTFVYMNTERAGNEVKLLI